MDKNRRGERGHIPFRTGRFFSVGGQWFFSTREGEDRGPYSSRQVAEAALLNFVRNRSFAHTRAKKAAVFIRESEDKPDIDDKPAGGYRFYW